MATITYFTDRSSAHQGLIGRKNYARQLIDLSRYNVISNDTVQCVNMAVNQLVTGIWLRVVSGAPSATSVVVGDGAAASSSAGFFSAGTVWLGSAYSQYVYYAAPPTNYSVLSLPLTSTIMSNPSYFRSPAALKRYTAADTIDVTMQGATTSGTFEIIVEYLQMSDT